MIRPNSPAVVNGYLPTVILRRGVWLLLLLSPLSALAQTNLVSNSEFLVGASCEGDWTGPCAASYEAERSSNGVNVGVVLEETDHILQF